MYRLRDRLSVPIRKGGGITALKTQVLPEGFHTLRRLDISDSITGYSDRMSATLNSAETTDVTNRFSKYLITQNAKLIRVSSFNTI